MNSSNVTTVNYSNGTFLWITHKTQLIVWYSTETAICAVAAILNILLLMTLLSERTTRLGSKIFIINLLVALIIQCTFATPLMFYSTFDQSHSNPSFCRKTGFFYILSYYAVDWADFTLGVNRFVAVCFPHFYPTMVENSTVAVMIIFSWLVPSFLAILPLAGLSNAGEYKPIPPWNGVWHGHPAEVFGRDIWNRNRFSYGCIGCYVPDNICSNSIEMEEKSGWEWRTEL